MEKKKKENKSIIMQRVLSKIRYNKAGEVDNTAVEKNKENITHANIFSPSLIPKFSSATHSAKKRMTTFQSPITRVLNKVSLEVNKLEISHSASTADVDCIFCIVRVGTNREISFTSSLVKKSGRGNCSIFSFSNKDTILGDIAMTDYSARYGLISIYAHSQEGVLLGEASISLVANPTEAISRNKIAILKDRRRVGEVFYSLTRPMEGFLDDSASEDGEQVAPTPSPCVVPSFIQLSSDMSPAAVALDLDMSIRSSIGRPSLSPLQFTGKSLNSNTATLLTMQNLSAHNQMHNSLQDAKVADKSNDKTESLLVDESRTNENSIDISPIPEQLEEKSSSVGRNLSLSTVENSSPVEPAVTSNAETKQDTPVATMCKKLQSLPTKLSLEDRQNHSPVVVSIVPATPNDATHESAVVAATPSLTVLGSVHRVPLSTSDRRAQIREYLKQQRTPANQETLSAKTCKSQVSGSARRTLAQVKERLQSWQTSDSPATIMSTPSTVDIEAVSNCSSVNTFSEKVVRRLSLATPDAPAAIAAASIDLIANSKPELSDPAICLMEDFEENSILSKVRTGSEGKEKFISVSGLSQFDLVEHKEQIVKNSSESAYQRGDEFKPKTSFSCLVLVFISVLVALTVGTLTYGVYFRSFEATESEKAIPYSELQPTKSPLKTKLTLRLSPPNDLVANEDGGSTPIQLNEELPFSVYTQLMLQGSSENTFEKSPENCLNWMSYSNPGKTLHKPEPTGQSDSKTGDVQSSMKKEKMWGRVKNWFQSFSRRLRNRFSWRARSKSLPKSLPLVTSNNAAQSSKTRHGVQENEQRVEGILRAGDCKSFTNAIKRKRENSWWRLRPVTVNSAVHAAQFQLQYLGDLAGAFAPTGMNDWCLSIDPSLSTTELRPCDMRPITRWQLNDNQLFAVTSTEEMVTTLKLHWQWDAQFRTQAVAVRAPKALVQEQNAIDVAMLTWLPTTTNNNEFRYESQRIDSVA